VKVVKEFYSSGSIRAILYPNLSARAFKENGQEIFDYKVTAKENPTLKKIEINVLSGEMFDEIIADSGFARVGTFRQVLLRHFADLTPINK
jgi:hypothetical protein